MVEQKPTTINIDLRLKSGQQALSDFATANAAAAATQNVTGVNDAENPLPITGSRPTPQSTSRNDEKRPSVMEPITKPAYPGAKHDVRGFCIRHPRCRLMRSVDGKEDGGDDPSNYRVVRKICPSCGEQSLVKKERKTPSHGFNPYNRGKAEKKEPSSDSAKMFTKMVPKSKSAAANAPHFRKKMNGNHKSSENEILKSGVNEKNTKNNDDRHTTNERVHDASGTNLRSSTKVEVPLPAKSSEKKPDLNKKEESRQKNPSEHYNKDEKHGRKERLHTQTSHNAGHHDRRDNLERQKSHNDAKSKKDELLQWQKSHDVRKTEELRRQKSQINKPKKQTDHHESANVKKSESERHEVNRQKSQGAMRQEEIGPSVGQKKEPHKGVSGEGILQHERAGKNRSNSEDRADVKLRRKNSSRRPPSTEAKHGEEAPSIMNESMPGKSSTSGSGEKKHRHAEKGHIDSKVSKSHSTPERNPKNATKKVVKRQSTQRARSLSPQHKLTHKSTTAVTKEEEGEAFHPKSSLKERSKSVGHPQQRQRLAPEFHYVHSQPVSHLPKSTLSTYRSRFYDDVMAQSCLQSLMDKNLKV